MHTIHNILDKMWINVQFIFLLTDLLSIIIFILKEKFLTKEKTDKPLIIETIKGKKLKRLPIWMMRQAGRHLPEYKELRAKNNSFLDFCYAPAAAAEATLQPISRYDIDAAIIFSDILVIPDALGQKVSFKEGVGPLLEPIATASDLAKLDNSKLEQRLGPVYEALGRVKEKLADNQALLGFAGAPWTLATYMIQGKGGDRDAARIFAYQNSDFMEKLFDILIDSIAKHLITQLRSGADAVQIFDSWAEDMSDYGFENWIIKPTQALVKKVRNEIPDAPIIGFPRGASNRAKRYIEAIDVDAFGLDIGADINQTRKNIGDKICLQGNLDPMCLVAGGKVLESETLRIVEAAKSGPHIFNLGHGVVPQTPIDNVNKMISLIRGA